MWLPLACPPTGDLARNSAMCPDRESNQGPFGTQASVLNPLSHTSQGTIIWNLKKIYPKNQTHREIRFMVTRGDGWGVEEFNKGAKGTDFPLRDERVLRA